MEKTAEAISLLEASIIAQQKRMERILGGSEEEGGEEDAVDLHLVNICAELCMTVGLWDKAASIIQSSEKCIEF
jgi:hypothetical protein